MIEVKALIDVDGGTALISTDDGCTYVGTKVITVGDSFTVDLPGSGHLQFVVRLRRTSLARRATDGG